MLLLYLTLLLTLLQSAKGTGKYEYAKEFVDTIHIVFSNHLDVGYHRGFDSVSCAKDKSCLIQSVLNEYWHVYFPLAIDVAERLENDFPDHNITYNWMTFPFLVSLYLDCQDDNKFGLKCPTKEAKNKFLDGVSKGYIWFNAFPFNRYGIYINK